jgi:hypothetical protein
MPLAVDRKVRFKTLPQNWVKESIRTVLNIIEPVQRRNPVHSGDSPRSNEILTFENDEESPLETAFFHSSLLVGVAKDVSTVVSIFGSRRCPSLMLD